MLYNHMHESLAFVAIVEDICPDFVRSSYTLGQKIVCEQLEACSRKNCGQKMSAHLHIRPVANLEG